VNEITDGWLAFKAVWGLLVTGVGFVSIKTLSRVDKLEETRVQKEDHERTVARVQMEHQRNVDRLEKSVADLRTEMHTGLNRIFGRLDEISDRIQG
jgi:hypothetical protein